MAQQGSGNGDADLDLAEPGLPAGVKRATGKVAGRDPSKAVQKAQDRLRRKAPRMARALEEMAEAVDGSGPRCPACGRGTKRDEAIRLKAVVAGLGIAGLGSPGVGRQNGAPSPELGAVLVFPPGTQMAVRVPDGLPGGATVGGAAPLIEAVRADVVAARQGGESRDARSTGGEA
jgi:hypothetical protein